MANKQHEQGSRASRPMLIAGIGLLAVALATVLALQRPPQPTPSPEAVEKPSVHAPDQPATTTPVSPAFDIARIGPTGDAVLAGRAAPGARVVIRSNDAVLGEVTADQRGEWVFVPEISLPPGAHRLTLHTPAEAGSPEVAAPGEVLVIIPEPGKTIAGGPGSPSSRPLAVLIPGNAATVVLQKPDGATTPATAIAVHVVHYDEAGRLAISGTAAPGAAVHLYIDDARIGEVRAASDGRWSLAPRKIDLRGSHRLRAEELDGRGRVTGQFSGTLALAPSARAEPNAVVVEAGESLWRIARRAYGSGVAYTIIFDANRPQIADPDLIYPGQVFTLPAPAPARTTTR
jgi:nucleoid-associated protein YgaU